MKTIFARTLLLTGVGILPVLAGNQVLLRNLNSDDGTPKVLAAGASGQLYVISTTTTAAPQISRMVKLDLNGTRLASIDMAQMATARAAVSDSQGDVIIVGADRLYNGIVVKVDSQMASATTLASLPAMLNAVALDGSGNMYLTGTTSSATFPLSAGAYQTTPPYSGAVGGAAYAFVTELSAAGKVIYSTYFGSDLTQCMGGSFCVGKYATTSGTAIALDASGAVVIAGVTTASGLPTTAGALAPTCFCGYYYGYSYEGYTSGFVAKFQTGAGQQLVWSTFLNGTSVATGVTLNGMALDAAGNVIVGGSASAGLPVELGTFQAPAGAGPASGAYLLKVNAAGTAVIWGTYLDSTASAVQAVQVDLQGRVVFSGYGGAELSLQPTFVARATGDGKNLTDFYRGPAVSSVGPALALTATGGFASIFETGALWIETASPGPSLLSVANSGSGEYASSLGPIELVTLYGAGIGPATPLGGQVEGGIYTKSLGGYQVTFNGVAAPLLYADSGQLNAVLPRLVTGSVHLQVVTPSGTVDGPVATSTYTSVPGVFQVNGLAAALNQDASVNSPSNPAKGGTIVSVFVNADSGVYWPDGSLAPLEIYDASTTVWVLGSSRSLEVLFAGPAPGIVNGVMQVNFRLPGNLTALQNTFAFSVVVGGVAAPLSLIAVAP